MSEIRISNIPVIAESAGVTTLTANNLTGNLTDNSGGASDNAYTIVLATTDSTVSYTHLTLPTTLQV